jgi:hypothetical protein
MLVSQLILIQYNNPGQIFNKMADWLVRLSVQHLDSGNYQQYERSGNYIIQQHAQLVDFSTKWPVNFHRIIIK